MNVALKSSHLCIDAELARHLSIKGPYILLSYQNDIKRLLLAPVDNKWFTKIHKADQYFLKMRNQQGDYATAIHGLLMDYEINSTDRNLDFEINSDTKFVKIDLT